MFYHAYNSYMQHAFPHDELKPLSKSFTDSLAELGNLQLEHLSGTYRGTALSLVDSLSTLAVLGDASEFTAGIGLLERHLSFNQDVRVNVFETNIRLLGGLLSAHVLASDSRMALMPTYNVSPPFHSSNLPCACNAISRSSSVWLVGS
jgi:mannosidase alpha-like ER degradation enhancer 1